MVKDFGSQKLPRFRAGQPLVEQVTAERLNDMCSMIEACRLQNGVGYTMNRSLSGTTLSILDSISTKQIRPWKISFGSEFEELEKSKLAIYTAKDDEALPALYIPNANLIRSEIVGFFAEKKVLPKSGDVIWNESDGIRYMIFAPKALKNCSSASTSGTSEHSFYRIKFTLNENDDFFAIYLGEHLPEPTYRTPTVPIPGPAGADGRDGQDGKDGEKGEKGDKGDKGDKGEKGDKGDKGDTGPQGPQGPQGEKGETGDKIVEKIVDSGAYDDTELRAKLQQLNNILNEHDALIAKLQGLTNDELYLRQQIEKRLKELENEFAELKIKISELSAKSGMHDSEISNLWNSIRNIPKGEKGDKGDAGPQGPKGEKGDKGDTGPQGPQGEKGETGDKVVERNYDDSAIKSSISSLTSRVSKLENTSPDLSTVNSSIASLESRVSSLENKVIENNSAIVNMRQDVDYVKKTINSAVDVMVVDANGKATTIKVLQSASGNDLMTSIYYYDVASQTMNEAKVFSNRIDQTVTGWKPTNIQFVTPDGQKASLTIWADQSTLEALGTVFKAEPCEVCEDGTTIMKYFLTPGETVKPEGN